MVAELPCKGHKTRTKLVETTAALLHLHGYHAVGLNRILAESGTPRGSLYFHFPGGKEELACASLAASVARAQAGWQRVLEAVLDPVHAVNLICEHIGQTMQASNGNPAARLPPRHWKPAANPNRFGLSWRRISRRCPA